MRAATGIGARPRQRTARVNARRGRVSDPVTAEIIPGAMERRTRTRKSTAATWRFEGLQLHVRSPSKLVEARDRAAPARGALDRVGSLARLSQA
jgi:hypothetical protein